MKILYAIQGTGNGHLARAMDVIPCLKKHGAVDLLISGTQADIELPYPVKYRLQGWGFIFGESGGVDIWKTISKTNLLRLIREIKQLPVKDYDLVISDFEPVSAWSCRFKGKACVGLSHQIAVIDESAPRSLKRDFLGAAILRYYAPSKFPYGFHFKSYAAHIYTPVIRKQVRAQTPVDKGHYSVYLPAYSDALLIRFLSRFPNIQWEVFSKHNQQARMMGNIHLRPVNNEAFIESMASSSGVLCGAGFETPAEALFLGKKVMVIPMTNQYEQHLNAAALQEMGIPIIPSLHVKYEKQIAAWLDQAKHIDVHYKDQAQEVINSIVQKHGPQA